MNYTQKNRSTPGTGKLIRLSGPGASFWITLADISAGIIRWNCWIIGAILKSILGGPARISNEEISE